MKWIHWLDENLEEVVLIFLLVAITCIMGLQVFCRYILNNSLSWSEELTRFLFIYMCFISISYCIKKSISIRIEQFIQLFSNKVYSILQMIIQGILLIFFILMSIHAWTFLLQGIASSQLSPALQIPMWWIQAAPLIGFILASIRSFQNLWIDGEKIFHKQWDKKEDKLC